MSEVPLEDFEDETSHRWNYIFEEHSGNGINDTCEADKIEKQGAYLGSC